MGDGGESAQGARRAGGDAEALRADGAETGAGRDSAAAARLWPPSRAVPAHHRRWLRSAQPRDGRVRRDHWVRAAAGPLGAHGGAARRGSHAARPRRSDRSAHQGDLRCAGGESLRSGSPPRRGARAGGSRDVAGDRRTQCAGARHRGAASFASWQRACEAEAATGEAEQAQQSLLAADIKRFLDRPADPMRLMPAPEAPPGAPIGEYPMDWLARPPM